MFLPIPEWYMISVADLACSRCKIIKVVGLPTCRICKEWDRGVNSISQASEVKLDGWKILLIL